MTLDLADCEAKARTVVTSSWNSRVATPRLQIESGSADKGKLTGAKSRKNMDRFLNLIDELVHANGFVDSKILLDGRILTLPGYFRPIMFWDMLILRNGRLNAAMEFKSHVGPSFSK